MRGYLSSVKTELRFYSSTTILITYSTFRLPSTTFVRNSGTASSFPARQLSWQAGVSKRCKQKLTEHLNSIDIICSIKFTYEQESDNSLPFLDTLMIRKEDGTVKLLVYRNKSHTDQYLNFTSHHPLHQKLGASKRYCIDATTSYQSQRTE